VVPLVIVVMDDGFEVVSEQIVVFSIVSFGYISAVCQRFRGT
jgi:hypothetical protein